MARGIIFLIIVGLIAGTVGCAQPAQYNLTISVTEGGEVVTPSEATSSYDKGAVVPLVALPHTGYGFVGWTGDVDTIDDLDAASTAITINGNYQITANFEKIPAPSTVTSLVFFDYSGNGIQDSGEPPLEGITLTYQPGNFSCVTATDGKGVLNIPAGSYRLYVDNPREFRYFLPSVSEVVKIEDGLSENITGNTAVAVSLAEGFLTLPILSNQVFSVDRYYDWDPDQAKSLWWNGVTGNDPYNHIGVFDIPLEIGTDALSAAPGVVDSYGEGTNSRYLIIRHQVGNETYFTSYGHISEILVKGGQQINRGDVIAKSGNAFNQYPHLHFDFFYGGTILIDAYKPVFNVKNKGYNQYESGNWVWVNRDDMYPNGLGFWTVENSPKYSK